MLRVVTISYIVLLQITCVILVVMLVMRSNEPVWFETSRVDAIPDSWESYAWSGFGDFPDHTVGRVVHRNGDQILALRWGTDGQVVGIDLTLPGSPMRWTFMESLTGWTTLIWDTGDPLRAKNPYGLMTEMVRSFHDIESDGMPDIMRIPDHEIHKTNVFELSDEPWVPVQK